MDPNPCLIRFHQKFFSGTNVPIFSDIVFYKLLEELNKIRGNNDAEKKERDKKSKITENKDRYFEVLQDFVVDAYNRQQKEEP